MRSLRTAYHFHLLKNGSKAVLVGMVPQSALVAQVGDPLTFIVVSEIVPDLFDHFWQ
jgi:hypothetical protein